MHAYHIDISRKIANKKHYCSARCVKKLAPFIKEIEQVAKLKTTLGRQNRKFLHDIIPSRNKQLLLEKLLTKAYISHKVLQKQSNAIKKCQRRYQKMAEKLMLVSPEFISKMLENISNKNANDMNVNSQLTLPPAQNLQLANNESQHLSAMENDIIPYNHDEYNKSLTRHIGNLETYKHKLQGNNEQFDTPKITEPTNSADLISGRLKGSVPKNFVRHAESVLQFINNSNGKMAVDSADNTLLIDGQKIPGSNVIDLITYLVGRKTRNNPQLPGLSNFLTGLKQLGIPKSLINEQSRLRLLENVDNIPSGLDPTVNTGAIKSAEIGAIAPSGRRRNVKHQRDPSIDIEPTKKRQSKRNKKKRGQSGSGNKLSRREFLKFSKWLQSAKNKRLN